MKEDIIIRQAKVEDENLISKFYKVAFGKPKFKYPERWNWIYKRNPFLTDKQYLPIWLALHQGKVVGINCLMPQHFGIKEKIIEGAWGHDFKVLPEYRGTGIGTHLEKLKQEAANVFSLDSSDSAVRIKKKIGYLSKPSLVVFLHGRQFNSNSLFDDMIRYLRLNHTSIFYTLGKNLRLPEFISVLMRVILRFKQQKIQTFNNKKTTLAFKSTQLFSEEVDELWNEVKSQYSLAVRRNSTYLNWKFVKQPHVSYQRYLVYQSAKLCGVLIFRKGQPPELPIGIISEFYTNQDAAVLRQMLCFAVSKLYQEGSLMIQCASSTEERFRVLSSMGFIPIRRLLPTFSLKSDYADVFTDTILKGNWLMGFGDHDCDQYPKISQPPLKNLIEVIFGRTPGDALIKSFH